ncbi:hypothetical protein HPB50_021820 [Hyalomma asiaticum]|uniref:Uncharacterized protein n=1 Tax=Hyalomma asiaticum TaxID=266040 RepID=A0ACB7RTA1_HYAAI|nr:hypothetical protein HPB50_021820 [Hyalomma asiaticum]
MRSHQGAHYKSGLTCNFIVKTSNDYRIAVVFETLQFPGNSGNCSDSLLLSNVEDLSGPICTSAVKEVISKGNIMNVTWSTGGGAPATSNDGFEAVVTAYKPGNKFCSFSEFRCANQRCVADNFACDGHNNCGDNSDEKCSFARSVFRDWGYLILLGVGIVAINLCLIVPMVVRRVGSNSSDLQQQQQPTCVVQQPGSTYQAANANAMPPTPYPGGGPAPDSSQPQMMRDFPGATGIPVNLETGRQMRFQAPPAELANVDYPRTTPVNPIVMSMPDTSAPSLPDAFGEAQPALNNAMPNEQQALPSGFADLQQPFRTAHAQIPPRQRMSMFQHGHPPLSLYEQANPLRPFPFFNMGGGLFGPAPFGGGPIHLGGPLGMPFGGPMGPFPPRMPGFIIIETGDDDSQSQDPLFLPDPHGGLPPSSTSSSNADAVFPTLLVQQRQQQMQQQQQQRAAEEEPRTPRRRHRHRHGTGGAGSLQTPTADSEYHDALQGSKDEQNDVKRQQRRAGRASPRAPPATGAIPQPAPPPKPAKKDAEKEAATKDADKTVMRIDRIETLTTAAAALQKMGLFGRPISAPSGKDCVAADSVVVRRAKSQWDAPLDSNHEQNKIIYDLPSVSTYDYASVWSNTSTTYSETTATTTETDGSRGTTTQQQTSGDDSDVNYLRPTVSLENITVLDNAQQRERELRERRITRKRE